MAPGQENYEAARAVLETVELSDDLSNAEVIAIAQVYATLALVAAFAGTLSGLDEKLAQLKFPWLVG